MGPWPRTPMRCLHTRASESLHGITPVETWSSNAMGTSVAAYFLYNIRASLMSMPVLHTELCVVNRFVPKVM